VTIKSAPYYWAVCDNCNERHEHEEFSAWPTEGDAINYALDSEWTTDGVRHHCPNCPSLTACERCGEPDGDEPGEPGHLCQDCWDKAREAAP